MVIGTAALKLTAPDIMKSYALTDCDIVIQNDMSVIRKCLSLFRFKHWQTTIWEHKVNEHSKEKLIKNRIYFRAKKDSLIVDVTYEFNPITWASLLKNTVIIDQIPVLTQEENLDIKRQLGKEKDKRVLKLFDH